MFGRGRGSGKRAFCLTLVVCLLVGWLVVFCAQCSIHRFGSRYRKRRKMKTTESIVPVTFVSIILISIVFRDEVQ